MPVLINSATFTDQFGNSNGFYRANAGDILNGVFKIEASIRMTSQGNPLNLDPSLNQVTSPGVSWVQEGFRVGQNVLVNLHSNGGGVLQSWWTTISYVDDVLCDFGPMPYWYDITNNEFITMYAVVAQGSTTLLARADMDLLFNHVKNNIPGSEFSLIDGEVTRAVFSGIDGLAVGDSVLGTLTGNQSGQFVIGAEIERVANAVSGFFSYELTVEFINSGIYDQSWFQSSDCLKIFAKMLWAVNPGEPFERTEGIYNLQANTGWFNEPHNSSINDSSFISGTSSIDYCVPSTFDVVVEGPLSGLGVGSSYVSITDDYYRIQQEPGHELAMMIGTQEANVAIYNSFMNPLGAAYDLEINSITTVVDTHTINITITPNAEFNDFIENRDVGDRLFYGWIKCGNINHLFFANQLTCAPPVGGPLIMESDTGYLDHSENITDAGPDRTGFVADTEDDVAYVGTFKLNKGDIYETFTAKLEAYNALTGDTFTLESVAFGFNGVQVSGAGVYLLNETQNITTELPTTSLKRDARLVLEPSIDTPLEFGVKIYAPWLLNWRSWVPLPSASVDFYPNQDNNWQQYNDLGDWELRTTLVLIKDGLAYTHSNQIIVRDYDAENFVDSSIELIVDATNTVVNTIPYNSLMRIRTRHINTVGSWDQPTLWGNITIESFEGQPRPMCSTVVPFDNDINNPLTPLLGDFITPVFIAPNEVVFECYFDSSKIDLSNGCSITSKVKDRSEGFEFLLSYEKEADVAYSLRKLSDDSIYSGPPVRVRRSGDNAEQDIPFDGTVIDEQELIRFVTDAGTNPNWNGYIVTWYDQSGNGNDSAQPSVTAQPLIVSNGVAVADPYNGRISVRYLSDWFAISSPIASTTIMYESFVFSRDASNNRSIGISESFSLFTFEWNNSGAMRSGMGTQGDHETGQNQTGNFLTTLLRDGSDDVKLFVNSAQQTTRNYANSTINYDMLNYKGGSQMTGYFQEYVYYPRDKEADRADIENNVNNFYLIW